MAGNRPARHETADVNARALTKFGIALVLLSIGALLFVVLVFNYFRGREGVSVKTGKLPPEPRLLIHEPLDLKQIRDAEDLILGSYAWLDPDRGVVRIPIGRAMEILAQRGLPARPRPGPQPASNVSIPTDSSLGNEGSKP